MRCSGLAQSRDAVPPISQRPLRRSTTFRGQQPHQCSGCPDHGLAWDSPRPGGPGIPLRRVTRGFPQAKQLQVIPAPWLRAFLSPHDPGVSPKARMVKFSLRRGGSELSSHRIARGFPSANWLKVFPLPSGSGVSPFAGGAGLSLGQRPRNYPLPGGPRFPPRRVAQSFLFADGTGLLLARRPGFAHCQVARGFPFAGYRPGGR